MGGLEENSKRKAKKGEVQRLILKSVKLAGILSIGLVAPNVIGAMDKLGLISNKRQGEIVSSSASKLAKKGLLKFNGKYYELTEEGEIRLRQLEIDGYKLPRPNKWDKKWRVIIFDIPEKKKSIREKVRKLFESLGLYRLQDSVWVYPYDCEDIVGLLKTGFGVGKDVLYMIVDEIENDRRLRDEFKLL
ncbi:MAG: CRISPR-associated endonuclease Cas2 [Candidatus Zambryskibacteria bacterium RIFCSPHIGHO2_01_FULL_44_22b]|uniref:CRISPR-associated endonuclease Cas2 n=1 Tax=Candidatus Zambryskibacteria bacterium RIFCSPHIGHO2_01_FULL_44_22b TaxID=1802737 RepID=A0A1G2T3W8_9BACT|nr:MAG: CRISPR-associated endonuclease Cas2 [Candidatus Zambryskibacteria bacterium RIFCSPHIGHO2_01_FULL_44_22b]